MFSSIFFSIYFRALSFLNPTWKQKVCYKLIHSVNLFLFFSILFPNIWLGTFILIPFIITGSPDSTKNSKPINPEFLTNNRSIWFLVFHQNKLVWLQISWKFRIRRFGIGGWIWWASYIYDMVWTRNKEKKMLRTHLIQVSIRNNFHNSIHEGIFVYSIIGIFKKN